MGLVEIGLVERSDSDGIVNDDVVEDGAVDLLVVVYGRNLPLSSHCNFASVAVRPTHGEVEQVPM
jgi:hypothetical protein